MPSKAYAILMSIRDDDDDDDDDDDYSEGYFYFPIKRAGRIYGGMPQFFGGTKQDGENDWDTIAREMAEESDDKITLEHGHLDLVYSYTENGRDKYNFYVASNYRGVIS
jgi:8-oxo-dGTP diphosphatase